MRTYKFTDGTMRFIIKIEHGIGIHQIVPVIAWKTNNKGEHITNFIEETSKPWTKKDIMKEVKSAFRNNGDSCYTLGEEATETQEKEAEKIVIKLFPELKED